MAVIKKRKWKNASGTHEAWRLDFTDRYGKRHREQFTLKRDCETRLAELQGSTRAGTYRALADEKTVADAAKLYCEYMAQRRDRGEKVTESYLRTERQHAENWIDPAGNYVPRKDGQQRQDRVSFKAGIGAVTLADLTARRVVQFRDEMRKHGAGVITSRRVLGTLSRVLKHAVENDLVANNVAKGIRVIGKRDEDRQRIVPPTKATMSELLQHAPEEIRLAIRFAAATGLRASEQWALKWNALDLEARRVSVDSRVDIFGEIDTTKSSAGKRTVPLGKALADALASYREQAKHNGDDDFVFTDSRGGFVRHTNMMKRHWKPLTRLAGVPDMGWHSLRHFAVSTWIDAGLQPKTVQTLAGHATYAITMDRYGHLFPSDNHHEAFDRLAEALA